MTQGIEDDNFNDAHEHLEDERCTCHPTGIEEIEVPHNIEAELAVQDLKIATPDQAKDDSSPMHHSSRGASLSTTTEHTSDPAASVHSLPVVHVTAPETTLLQRPSTARPSGPSFVANRARSSEPTHSQSPQEDGNLSRQQQRAQHRSVVEVRTSNRLSGFFTNLIHRRDYSTNGITRHTIQEDPQPATTPSQPSNTVSRSPSPVPGRSITPPPPLPAPTLHDLGLTLSVLTSDLSPSHFSTPPSSGAFLLPHYLLLCHAQGLDVLPLVSPPASQPYALVRRVSFKSVVVMEQRGVLVAIAGRRDGVRVYALEEVKKAIEWRMDVEVRRERDRVRRETLRKIAVSTLDGSDSRNSVEKTRKASLSTPPPGELIVRTNLLRKGSHGRTPIAPPPPPPTLPAPLIPRSPTPRTTKKARTPSAKGTQAPPPSGYPPPYSTMDSPPLRRQNSVVSVHARSGGSVSNVLSAVPVSRRNTDATRPHNPDFKADWDELSDEDAIDVVAAGTSGSQALDERTSARLSATLHPPPPIPPVPTIPPPTSTTTARRSRPSNLDLTLARSSNTPVASPEPSPSPTLLSLRQALLQSSPTLRNAHTAEAPPDPDTPFDDVEDEDDDLDGRISLAQALLESRIPELPPIGTRRPQQPILITSSHPVATGEDEPSSPRTSEGHNSNTIAGQANGDRPERRRRRWSVILGSEPASHNQPVTTVNPLATPPARERIRPNRSLSFRSSHSQASTVHPSSSSNDPSANPPSATPDIPEATPSVLSSHSSRSSRFIPRIISYAFHNRRSEDRPPLPVQVLNDGDTSRKTIGTPFTPHAPPPKLEYVKLPGTKGALMVKAVETAKKSFLAILCGDSGEKVELFAGTYRTALGLSRTFILPDSPRSLELQLQGDDLVEVFLVFSQNVFGLEPATVRVREVRIGRAERRAARRRAREAQTGEGNTNDSEAGPADEDTNTNVSIGVSVAVGSSIVATGDGPHQSQNPQLMPEERPNSQLHRSPSQNESNPTTNVSHPEELVTVGNAQMGPYTTFQQLNFAPRFPLASIADDYIIPPTYREFLEYRAEHEPEVDGNNVDLTQIQFSPPGLPLPIPTAPSKWYYRDPKNVVHGPWKASLMQSWYKDGMLPPDLPVRREEDTKYMLLKDLRQQSVDPTHPFQYPPPPLQFSPPAMIDIQDSDKPLLAPISLLAQPRHFGPPALFFSSRGGHSTAVVDARGRSVLKGRLMWSRDEHDEDSKSILMSRMGDVKRLEAFDVENRSVLVAMRQGGLEAVDLSDALLRPADESRTTLPQFSPSISCINRRAPFVWKMGTPVSISPTSATSLSSKGKGSGHHSGKKQSTGSTKSPAGRTEFSMGDTEPEIHDEVLFLGRKDDEIYICERNAGSFRILRLCPDPLRRF